MRAVWGIVGVAVLSAVVYGARRSLLTAIGSYLVVEDDVSPADAIVVLSGSLPDRILEAVDLFQAHVAPRIILTRGEELPGLAALRARGGALPELHEENLAIAQQLGVPAVAVAVMPRPVSSTLGEAQALVAYLRAEHIKSIVLVTSKTHARRARMTFGAVADGSLRIAVRPSRYDPFTVENWWQHHSWARRVVTEYAKLLNYLLVDQWRVHAQRAA